MRLQLNPREHQDRPFSAVNGNAIFFEWLLQAFDGAGNSGSSAIRNLYKQSGVGGSGGLPSPLTPSPGNDSINWFGFGLA